MEPTITEHISKTPGVCGGKACIAGTRIRVQDVYVWHELQGQSADEIVSRFPQLSRADVHAALAYYWDHREEIEQEMKAAEELVASLKASEPSPLRQKLLGRDADGNSLSSR
ncbi:MAG: DUF433 domain-containing protein [Planctomycetaceae bacterium]